MAVLALCVADASAPRRAQAETGPVKVAHQVDRDSGRLLLEFPKAVDYGVERFGNDLYLRFSQPIVSDIAPAQRTLARYVSEMRLAGGGRVLVIRMIGQPRMTHYRRGNAVTIVWIGAGTADTAAVEKPAQTKPAETKPPVPRPAEPGAAEKPDPSKAPAAPRSEEKAATPPTPPRAADPPAPPKAAENPAPRKALDKPASPPAAPAEPKAAEKAAPPKAEPPVAKPDKAPESKRADATPPKVPPAAGADPAGPAVGPALAVTYDGTETRIVATWPEPTAAAVFRHGDTVWMVFARRQAFDLAAHQKRLGPGVERLTRHEHAEATVLAARVRTGMAARATRDRNAWTISLRPSAAGPGENDLKLAVTRGAVEQVTVALPGAETPVRIADPESGAVLFVVPSRSQAAASGDRRFVTFRVLAAAQGAVIEALADGIAVSAEGTGLAIRRSGGLLISGGTAPGLPAQGQ